MAQISGHLSVAELEEHYRAAREVTEARHLQAIWLLAQGRTTLEVADVLAFTPRWVEELAARYNAAGVAGLGSRRSPGRPPLLSEARGAELKALVLAGPDPERHAVVRWRCLDLREEITLRWSVRVCEQTVGRWLRQLGLSRVQPRPCHPEKDPDAAMAFKTYGPPRLQVPSVPGLNSLRQRIRPMGIALAKMEIRTVRSS